MFFTKPTFVWAQKKTVSGAYQIGSTLEGFEFHFPGASPVNIESLRGNLVLINFWATWCPPCIEEMPSMDELSRRLKSKAFNLIAVSVDDNWEPVEEFLQQLNRTPSFAIAHDPLKSLAMGRFGIEKYPESFLIDKNGRIRAFYQGSVNWSSPEILAKLNEILNEK